jgi:hypothetical protein
MLFNRLFFLVLCLFCIGVLLMLFALAGDYLAAWKKRRATTRLDRAVRSKTITRVM